MESNIGKANDGTTQGFGLLGSGSVNSSLFLVSRSRIAGLAALTNIFRFAVGVRGSSPLGTDDEISVDSDDTVCFGGVAGTIIGFPHDCDAKRAIELSPLADCELSAPKFLSILFSALIIGVVEQFEVIVDISARDGCLLSDDPELLLKHESESLSDLFQASGFVVETIICI